MKNILNHKGQRIIVDTHEPWCGAYEVKVKVKYSAVSFGTESGGLESLKYKNIIFDKVKWEKAINILKNNFNIFDVYKKFINIRKSYVGLGYSAVGEIIEIGSRCKVDYNVGDLVHVGGEYATHSQIVSVPQNFVFKLNKKENIFLYSLPTIASVPIHAINHAKDILIQKDKINTLVIGGGVIGTFGALYANKLGYDVFIADLYPNVLADNFFKRFNNEKIDLFVVCTTSMIGIEKYLEFANDGAVMSVVGEVPLEVDRAILEDKYMSVRFCKSFGYGRGDKSYEFGISNNIDTQNFPYTIRQNIQDAISLIDDLINDKKFMDVINIYDFDNEKLVGNKINVINWSKK